jgi:hypothetical protein
MCKPRFVWGFAFPGAPYFGDVVVPKKAVDIMAFFRT